MLKSGINKMTPEDAADFIYAAATFHQLCRYFEYAYSPPPGYLEYMCSHATDIPDYDVEDGEVLRNKVIKDVAKMKVKKRTNISLLVCLNQILLFPFLLSRC